VQGWCALGPGNDPTKVQVNMLQIGARGSWELASPVVEPTTFDSGRVAVASSDRDVGIFITTSCAGASGAVRDEEAAGAGLLDAGCTASDD